MSSNLLKSLLLDLFLNNIMEFCFVLQPFFQNTTNQRPPLTSHVDHDKSANRPLVCRGEMTRLSASSPCQPWHLLTNTLSGIVINYCSVYRGGRPSSAIVFHQSLIWQERQQNIDTQTVFEFLFWSKFCLLPHSVRK